MKIKGECELLRIFIGESDRWEHRPLYEAIVRKEGDRLIVEPIRKGRLLALLGTLGPLDEPFPDVDEDLLPLDDVEI